MLFLADENFPVEISDAIRDAGHDIAWVGYVSPGITDEQVVALAVESRRTILTFDKDFGYLAFQLQIIAPAGIMLFRVRADSPPPSVSSVVDLLDSPHAWAGYFTVVENNRIRMSRLPDANA